MPEEDTELDEPRPVCVYPSFDSLPSRLGDTVPPLSWRPVINPHGEQEETFSLEDFYCDDERYGEYSSITFVIYAEWCPNCPTYIRRVEAEAEELAENGSLIVWLMVQDSHGNRPSAEQTHQYVSNVLTSDVGYRLGSMQQSREGDFSALYSFFPNAFIVRRADMKIVGHQEVNTYYLMFSNLASLCVGIDVDCEQ